MELLVRLNNLNMYTKANQILQVMTEIEKFKKDELSDLRLKWAPRFQLSCTMMIMTTIKCSLNLTNCQKILFNSCNI